MAGLVGQDRRRNGPRPANGQRDARRRTLNKGLRDIATAKGLSTTQQAMLFFRTSFASADALIACWNDKAHWLAWRPQTVIREAASDGNDATTADPNWTSLFPTPGYPDYPSGYNCYTQGLWYSARLFFGTDKVDFSLTSPGAPLNPPTVPVAVSGVDPALHAVLGRRARHHRGPDPDRVPYPDGRRPGCLDRQEGRPVGRQALLRTDRLTGVRDGRQLELSCRLDPSGEK